MRSNEYASVLEPVASVETDSPTSRRVVHDLISVGVYKLFGWSENSIGVLVRAFGVSLRRRAVIRELSRLDDRTLADIGIERGQIPKIADDLVNSGRTQASGANPAPHAELSRFGA